MNSEMLQSPATELQRQLQSGELTSVQLVGGFLDQITAHNHDGMHLNALISVLDRSLALDTARILDEERAQGKIRSSLHGIPIVIKDCIVTDPRLGMPTTVGSHMFSKQRATGNAPVVDQLLESGLIVIGKGNMTEFLGLKSDNTPIGWSAVGGQTLSAHRSPDLEEKDQPTCGGSSSGPATAIAAGFSPLGIGTETSGSVVYPASCCGLYGMKLTPGSVSTAGVFKLSNTFDGLGVLGRTPKDLAPLTQIILNKERRDTFGTQALASISDNSSWLELGIGMVGPTWGVAFALDKWSASDVKSAYEAVPVRLKELGTKVEYPLDIPDGAVLKCGEDSLITAAYAEFPKRVEEFIANFEENSTLRCLADVIRWNEEHPEALPAPYTTQTELIRSHDSKMSEDRHQEVCSELRRLIVEGQLGNLMSEKGLDIILAPSDSTMVSYSACAGWPIATVPLSRMKSNGQPFGLFALARENREDLLLKFMHLFERDFPKVAPAMGPFKA
ncbi:amidase signature enzyme [Xylaria bambusicola]|uniref:amidase signature enzyme n=1 Tax=Xylaria bambusicola TaxID=326684 RepID=UPI002008DE59|nr:amidase signature enzyme [Xylaria bambusicola]KAI0514735.1 amidase signature enzyme [Xylaria bambusicola]